MLARYAFTAFIACVLLSLSLLAGSSTGLALASFVDPAGLCPANYSTSAPSLGFLDLTLADSSPPASPVLGKRAPALAPAVDTANSAAVSLHPFFDLNAAANKKPKLEREVSGVQSNISRFYWQGSGAHTATDPPPSGQMVMGVDPKTGKLGWAKVKKSWKVTHYGDLFEMSSIPYDLIATGNTLIHTRSIHDRKKQPPPITAHSPRQLQNYAPVINDPLRTAARQVQTIWTNPLGDLDWLAPFVQAGALPARWLNDASYSTRAIKKAKIVLNWICFLFADGGKGVVKPRSEVYHYLPISQYSSSSSDYLHKISALVSRYIGNLPNGHSFRLAEPGYSRYKANQEVFHVTVVCKPLFNVLEKLLDGPLLYNPVNPAHQASYDQHDATLANQRVPPPRDVCPRDSNSHYIKRYLGWLAHRLSKAMARVAINGWGSGDGEWKYFKLWFNTTEEGFGDGLRGVNGWVTSGDQKIIVYTSSLPAVWDFVLIGILAEYRVHVGLKGMAGDPVKINNKASRLTVPAFRLQFSNARGDGWSNMVLPETVPAAAGGVEISGLQMEGGLIPIVVRDPEWDGEPTVTGAMNVKLGERGKAGLVHMVPSAIEFPVGPA